MASDEGLLALCAFVTERLNELERDAPLLSEGKHTGLITETWLRDRVEADRTMVRLLEMNLGFDKTRDLSLKWAVYSIAEGFKHHQDFDAALWGA